MRNRFVRLLFASVALLAVWEPRAAFAQGPLTNGGNHAGAISTPGEIDEWTFTAALGDSILLSLGEVLPSGPEPCWIVGWGVRPGVKNRMRSRRSGRTR